MSIHTSQAMFPSDLPHEDVVSIQRVLDIQPNEEVDRLDGLSERFNPVEILNDFFPDGASFSCLYQCYLEYSVQRNLLLILMLSVYGF